MPVYVFHKYKVTHACIDCVAVYMNTSICIYRQTSVHAIDIQIYTCMIILYTYTERMRKRV
jgi:hypothetical protein